MVSVVVTVLGVGVGQLRSGWLTLMELVGMVLLPPESRPGGDDVRWGVGAADTAARGVVDPDLIMPFPDPSPSPPWVSVC